MDFKQKFEPKGNKVIHGAGQDDNPFNYPNDFKNYWEISDKKPLLFMTYIQLKYVNSKWFDLIKKNTKDFKNIILQIGLSMSDTCSGEPEKHYENEVYSKKYDDNINAFFEGVKNLGIPCFVRLGYEFNGLSWYGYNPSSFVKSWVYIIKKSRDAKVKNIAWIWHYAPEGVQNYMDYYPGDEYVDWWGVTFFLPNDIKNNNIFIKDAKFHKKPVMICESSARGIGVNESKKSWNNWFKIYFEWIKNNPIIKGFCYINWDWSKKQEIWKDWGNCVISNNEYVKKKYVKELEKKKYIHNINSKDFLKIVYK
ncbi:MAG: glycosyl hydrolase [Methanobacterium sp.]|nr:glycosyl hydrolase [Methanobacterium sp.]